MLSEASSYYCWNLQLYTDRDEDRVAPLGEHVVLSLTKDLTGRGINVTMDNGHLTLLGTIKANKRERDMVPAAFQRRNSRTFQDIPGHVSKNSRTCHYP